MDAPTLKELVLQALEHERGGVSVYETAVRCAVTDELKEEWKKYLKQTRRHVTILEDLCKSLRIDRTEKSVGAGIVAGLGRALVSAMQAALAAGDPQAAELVACECVVLAETKDHLDWELLSACGKAGKGAEARALTAAAEEVEEQEDEHLYHSRGWCRELWRQSLGLKAVLPPPEEKKHVTTAIGAARAEQAAHPK